MDINQIDLSAGLLKALYGKNLIMDEAREPAAQNAPSSLKEEPITAPAELLAAQPAPPVAQVPGPWESNNIQFLGKNNRHMAILVYYPSEAHIADADYSFLLKILEACQFTAADVAIINTARQQVSLEDLTRQLAPQHLVMFGTPALEGNFPQIPAFSPTVLDGIHYLHSPALHELNGASEGARGLKKQLWEGLKQMLKL
ncbi:hypothetical protein KJS94_07600 [Flavihumibacter rivuli]|uniref:hypothetical protein n=1 Tax=Flavihumibacter rivuli TaxID=2838156 RepID=UPI001BDEF0B6|nr:hypothetical protein [Flavihumibacter rivuli]ULQ58065.1 hypothetical protein KJS94_07600 [Flavihumibacter rivuli]